MVADEGVGDGGEMQGEALDASTDELTFILSRRISVR